MRHYSQRAGRIAQLLGLMLYAAVCVLAVAHAGIRGRGKYSGVVFFDRWDSCLLLNGNDVMYIAESQKQRLRPYAGEAIDLDATEVLQPMNPGDARIQRYNILGAVDTSDDAFRDGLRIEAESDFGGRRPAFFVQTTNVGTRPIETGPGRFGPTLLGINPKNEFTPSDGKSVAWMTRVDLTDRGSSRFETSANGSPLRANFAVDPGCRFPDPLTLQPNQSIRCRVTFDLPPGEFQFVVGYARTSQSRALVSNALSFRIEQDGTAVLEP